MGRVPRFIVCVACCMGNAYAELPVRLATHELSPYGSYVAPDGRFDGVAVQVVDCAMRRLGRAYELQVVPWARAQRLVETDNADGFFAASKNAERDRYAVMSEVIAEQEWRWYLLSGSAANPASSEFHKTATVGSFIGGNMLKWLKQNGYRVEAQPVNTDQLLAMLLKGRVDAILANNLVMAELIRKHGLESQLRSVLQENKPLGVYFSKAFLAAAVGFIDNFNHQVRNCRFASGG